MREESSELDYWRYKKRAEVKFDYNHKTFLNEVTLRVWLSLWVASPKNLFA
jgi:hypothetical protein